MCQNLLFVQVLNVLQPVYNLQIPWEMDWKQRPRVGKGICRHARGARPQDFRLFSKSDTPFQHFLCPTGSGPDYNFINSGCSFYNAPQILAKGVGFSVANPQFLALSSHPLGGALLNEGEGRPTFLIRRRRNIVNIGRRRLLGCFPFRCKYCEWELK